MKIITPLDLEQFDDAKAGAMAVRSASLRGLAVNRNGDPDILHDAADMLYDASKHVPALVAEVKALRECLAEMTERYSKLEVLYFKRINQDETPETNGTIERARALLPS